MASFFNLILDTTAPAGVTLALNDDARYTTKASITAKIGCEDAVTTGYQMKIWGGVDGAATEDAAEAAETANAIPVPPESQRLQ